MERDIRRITIPVGNKTRTVNTRVMEERETADGELAEVSRNFVSNCFPSRDVYYFGEEVDNYEDGEVVDHDGAWLAGRRGARPGLLMPEDGFLLGQRYFQEVAPDVALDRAEHIRTGFSIRFPPADSTTASKSRRPHHSSRDRSRRRSTVAASAWCATTISSSPRSTEFALRRGSPAATRCSGR